MGKNDETYKYLGILGSIYCDWTATETYGVRIGTSIPMGNSVYVTPRNGRALALGNNVIIVSGKDTAPLFHAGGRSLQAPTGGVETYVGKNDDDASKTRMDLTGAIIDVDASKTAGLKRLFKTLSSVCKTMEERYDLMAASGLGGDLYYGPEDRIILNVHGLSGSFFKTASGLCGYSDLKQLHEAIAVRIIDIARRGRKAGILLIMQINATADQVYIDSVLTGPACRLRIYNGDVPFDKIKVIDSLNLDARDESGVPNLSELLRQQTKTMASIADRPAAGVYRDPCLWTFDDDGEVGFFTTVRR